VSKYKETIVRAAEDNVLQGDAVRWEPITICCAADTITRLYVLFLLIAIIVGVVRMVKLWIAAPPFLLKRQIDNPGYLRALEGSSSSLRQWIGCTLLVCGLVSSYHVATFGRTFPRSKTTGAILVLDSIQYLGTVSCLAFVIVFLLFLAQWHMRIRIQHLRK
jgi:hypothetical protein